jgi:CheY-like chemotaxis protein/AraC-like DNA-binding protein/anti-sigma regulatory factor (Ser/Thr protein kinase)
MELNENRLSFFTNISHELRSPLSLIINPIREMLKNDNSNPDSFNLGIIYSNAQRLLKMTDRLLMFRKVDNELGEPQREPVDLLNLCRQVFFCFGEEARAKSLRYTFNSSLGQSMTYADPEKIEIIIYNIIANAVKFCPKTGEVDVNLEEIGDNFILSVRDSGPGIPPQLGGRLFERFTQAPVGEPAGLQKGFGIGMYLAKALTDMHQGELSYECPPSGGTIFRLGLKRLNDPISSPITEVEEGRNDEARTEDVPSSFNEKSDSSTVMLDELVSNRKILLVVDDDRQVTAYIRHIFSDLTVYETASAEEGLEKVQQITPDIIISDIFMGGADGLEFCKKMKAGSLAYIPIVFLTSHGAADMRLKGAESGADEFITKPFEVDLLRARVYHILKDRELLKKYFFNEITLQSNPLKISDEYSGFLATCIAIVQEHIDRDDFDSKLFAKLVGMSRSRLYTKVKSISGLSVNEFVKLIRLRKAAEQMIHTNGQIKEISFQVGFSDAKYFREQFTRLFGIKPSEYIRKYRKNFQDNRNLNEQFAKIKAK